MSIRSFISSKGRTSATSWTPTAPRSGRAPPTKWSSTTHWRNGSCRTGERSRRPVSAATRSMSSGLVAGTMRSTMVLGKAPSAAIQSARAGSTRRPSSSTTPRAIAPLSGRLSQVSTVKGAAPAARRRSRARTRKPGAERGACRVREVVDDVGMGAVQAAGGRVVAVALLGDGQGDDADVRVGHAGDDGLGVLGGDEHVLRPRRRPAGSRRRGRARGRCRRSPAGARRSRWSGRTRLTPTMPQSPPAARIASAT